MIGVHDWRYNLLDPRHGASQRNQRGVRIREHRNARFQLPIDLGVSRNWAVPKPVHISRFWCTPPICPKVERLADVSRAPNHILLDYYNSNGLSPFKVAASINGVSAPTNTVASANPTVSTTGTSGSGTAKASASATMVTSKITSGATRTELGLAMQFGHVTGLGVVLLGLIGGALGVMA